jgi:high-affinity iron transporter
MLPTLIIVFREVLEAALIVGIVMAATKGLRYRSTWIAAGVGAGVAAASLVATFAGAIAAAAEGMGQELFNAGVLFAAVVMLGWHNVWMGRHAREIVQEMGAVGKAVASGTRPLYALAIVVAVAVLREGSEVVLFLYGIAAGGSAGADAMLAGGLLGLLSGVAAGAALYLGLLRIPVRHLFTVTSWMILLLAAGMAAQGADFLTQAGFLPPLGEGLWDSSAALPEHSILGQILHTFIGYAERPSGVQLVFYVTTLALIGGLMRLAASKPDTGKGRGAKPLLSVP